MSCCTLGNSSLDGGHPSSPGARTYSQVIDGMGCVVCTELQLSWRSCSDDIGESLDLGDRTGAVLTISVNSCGMRREHERKDSHSHLGRCILVRWRTVRTLVL